MEILTDILGTVWELIDINEHKVRLQNRNYNEISDVYKRSFIENAIQGGLLKRLELENGQVQKTDQNQTLKEVRNYGKSNGRSQ